MKGFANIEILRDFYILGILLILPLIMVFTLMMLIYFYISFFLYNLDKIQMMLEKMPPSYLDTMSQYTELQQVVILPIKIIGLPFFLLLPLLISGIITSDSFAGERERNTLETLLVTPIRDFELFLGKIFTSFIPTLLVTWVCFLFLTHGISNMLNPHFITPVFPDRIWILSILFIVPLFIAGTILVEILISSLVSSVKSASALNMFLTLPVLIIILMQATGYVLFSQKTLPWLFLFFLIFDGVLFWIGLRLFRRGH